MQLARLVPRQRLRRIEVERACGRIPGERVEHRQVERERLPARGPGRDDRVSAVGRRERLRLVGVELADAAFTDDLGDGGMQLRRQLTQPSGMSAIARAMDDLHAYWRQSPTPADAIERILGASVVQQ